MSPSFDVVRTQRLQLRRLVDADVPAVVAISTDPRTNLHRPGGPPTAAQSAAMCRRFMEDWERHGLGYWTVRCDDRIVGIAGVMAVELDEQGYWNLYYRFSPDVWGRGIAAEAARAALQAAAEHSPQRPVIARTRPTNAAAIRLAIAIGLVRTPPLDVGGLIAYASSIR